MEAEVAMPDFTGNPVVSESDIDMREWEEFADLPLHSHWKNQPRYGICPWCGTNHFSVWANGVYCYHCDRRLDIYEYLTMEKGVAPRDAYDFLKRGRGLSAAPKVYRDPDPVLSDVAIEYLGRLSSYAHKNLSAENRAWWLGRGVSERAIDRFQLGYHRGWYTIPGLTEQGIPFVVKRRWGDVPEFANENPKGDRYRFSLHSTPSYTPWKLTPSYGEGRRYALIVPGEIKALTLWSYFDQQQIDCTVITTCASESTFPVRWRTKIIQPSVILWHDTDAAGAKFVSRVKNVIGRARIVYTPPESGQKKVDDYLLAGGDVLAVLRAAGWKL